MGSDASIMRRLIDTVRAMGYPTIEDVMLVHEDGRAELYEDRKWVRGRFKSNIGIDQPTSGAGQTHAHVYGRNGTETVVVNIDGSSSHGTKGKLHSKDAEALRSRGFTIPDNNIIEWYRAVERLTFLTEEQHRW